MKSKSIAVAAAVVVALIIVICFLWLHNGKPSIKLDHEEVTHPKEEISSSDRPNGFSGTTTSGSQTSLDNEPAPQTNTSLGELDLNSVRSLPTLRARLEALNDYFGELAKSDGAKTIALAKSKLSHAEYNAILPKILGKWSETHPKDAIEWYLKATSSDAGDISLNAKRAVIDSAFSALASTNPAEAVRMSSLLPNEDEQNAALSSACDAVILDGKQAEFLNAVNGLSTDSTRLTALSCLLNEIGAVEPDMAKAIFAQQIKESDRSLLLSTLGSSLMQTDPVDGARWWLENSRNDAKQETVGKIVEEWARTDKSGPANWVNSMPKGPIRDSGVVALANSIYLNNPNNALEWAATIQAPQLRNDTWIGLYESFLNREPDSAKETLAKAPIDLQQALAEFEKTRNAH